VVAKTYILENLRVLDHRYRKARTPKEALFCSKLAILELCGWIEESMDDIVLRCAVRHLSDQANLDFCNREIIKKNYGFDYHANFRSMLIRLMGLVAVEKLERKVDPNIYVSMAATLAFLKTVRNAEAHTHLKGVTRILNAPSFTIGQFQPVYDGLVEFEQKIRRIKL
jgi:hypothetical protein